MTKLHVLTVTVVALLLVVGTMGTVAAQANDGPPEDLPGPVPDFVSELLGAITDFIDGVLSLLGEALRTITPNAPVG